FAWLREGDDQTVEQGGAGQGAVEHVSERALMRVGEGAEAATRARAVPRGGHSGMWEGAPESPPSIRPGGRHDDEGGPGDTPASVAWLRAGRGTGYAVDRDRLVPPSADESAAAGRGTAAGRGAAAGEDPARLTSGILPP